MLSAVKLVARVKKEGMRPKRSAQSATIRYNRIAYWKRKEILRFGSYLVLPCKTDELQRLMRLSTKRP